MRNKIKLAILGTRGIPARYGGFETFVEELSVRLVKMGVDVTVYCEIAEKDSPDSYKGIRLKYIPSPDLGPLTTLLFDLRCLWHARRGYDVVYMLGYGASIFCFIPRIWGSRVWINMDGIEWARSKWRSLAKAWFRLMEAIAMRTADRIIADAEGIRQNLESRHRHMPPCSVIPYGAPVIEDAPPITLLDEWGISPFRYYLIVCRLEPENKVHEIIEGFVASDSTCTLVVVGDHSSGTAYVNSLLKINDNRINFIGTVYDKVKLQVLRYHAFAYFHGHSVGGTNPSLLEALGCGNLIIAHDNIFNREVAADAAIYFGSADEIPAIISAIEAYPPDKLKALSQKGRNRIKEKYNWDAVTNQYLQLLRHYK